MLPPGQESPSPDDALMRALEDDLKATKEDLQGSIEQLESANEELKSANEEVMSINEELQSINEELETSKEELQSLNEELTTVNNQLEGKIGELEAANDDLNNLLVSTNIATIFLDSQYRIRRFTPAATMLFNLIPADGGRPLSDISPKFTDPDLLADADGRPQRSSPPSNGKCRPRMAAGISGECSPIAPRTTGSPESWSRSPKSRSGSRRPRICREINEDLETPRAAAHHGAGNAQRPASPGDHRTQAGGAGPAGTRGQDPRPGRYRGRRHHHHRWQGKRGVVQSGRRKNVPV